MSLFFELFVSCIFLLNMSIPTTYQVAVPGNWMQNCECNYVHNVVIKPIQSNFEGQELLVAHLVSAVQCKKTLALLLNMSLSSITVLKEEKSGITQSLIGSEEY